MVTIVQSGQYNPAAISAPGGVVQILPPAQTIINGVPTNIIGVVGTGVFGPINSPTFLSPSQFAQIFGPIQTNKYDLGTAVMTAAAQGAQNFVCVRVTDSTDTKAAASILDATTPVGLVGMYLTSLYSGSYGDQIQAIIGTGSVTGTYRITISLPNLVPEVFDNIAGTGLTLWQAMVDAINLGQGGVRGPSSLVTATLNTGISGIAVATPGSFSAIPSLTITGAGSGGVLSPIMEALNGTVSAAGTDYDVGDTITITGGTYTTQAVLEVLTVNGSGGITSYKVDIPGEYTGLPSNPVSPASTSGLGTGATFTLNWALLGAVVVDSGEGYDNTSTLVVTPGGGSSATLAVGTTVAPDKTTYTLSGGTDGIDNVTDATLLGSDTLSPRTGMYALSNSGASIGVLADADSSTTWSAQLEFGLRNGTFMGAVCPPANGYPGVTITEAIAEVDSAGVRAPGSYGLKVLVGDWIYWQDQTNNVERLISPQGFWAGTRAVYSPEQPTLNKQIYGIIATQSSSLNQQYAQTDILRMMENGLDVIALPSPGGQYYACQTGINTAINLLQGDDSFTTLTNFLAVSIYGALGQYIGQLITPTVQMTAKNSLQSFLQGLAQAPTSMINAFSVAIDASPNPFTLIMTVQVVNWKTLRNFLVNLQNGNLAITLQSVQQLQ
jgi:hypothetical protein